MSILERDPKAPAAWHGNLPVTSRYTYGMAGERFFRTLMDEGKLMGAHCPTCERTYVPAALFCERCLSELTEWVDVGTVGTLHTFTALHVHFDGTHREKPELIGFIAFGDGGLIHRLGEVSLEDLSIGIKMEMMLKPEDQRKGSILDIAYFRPVE